jgi:hypothetical protein
MGGFYLILHRTMARAISLKPSPIGDFATQRGGTDSAPT